MTQPLWTPTPEQIARANVTRFREECIRWWSVDLPDFAALYRWSIAQPERFWESVWRFGEVRASRRADRVVENFDRMPGATWFPGARLNFAENLLRHRDDRPALVCWSERGRERTLTYADLHRETARVATWLKAQGIRPGDRIAGFVPNVPEAVIAMLAATSLGAIWSSTSPDFGRQGLRDRFGQIEPRVLFTADGYGHKGVVHDSLGRVRDLIEDVPSIERVVVIPYVTAAPSLDGLRDAARFDELGTNAAVEPLTFAQLPFDHPVYVLYSSGTTGAPKCIVHGAGGTLLQHLKEHLLHCDLRRDDRMLYVTTCGWMMWNWLVSGLAVGATLALFDGAPLHPHPARLFDLIDEERITVFGTSAGYLGAIRNAGIVPRETHDLSSLRSILSTGSVLPPESFDYVYQQVPPDVRLSSISGGTDIVSCFALGNPVGPVWRGELQTRGLGMQVAVYDDEGRAVRGEKGELVCEAPFPSMPIGFWNDPDGAAYRRAYFDVYPGVWRHGDWVEHTDRDGLIFHGRSDAVLNPGGIRIGTAEIYRLVEQEPEVEECLAIGQDWQDDVRVVLFVRLRNGRTLDDGLRRRLQDRIRRGSTPRHVPKKIVQVADLPKTKSGKLVELAVRDVIHGRPLKNREALANPESLDLFRDLPELAT